MGRAGAPAPAHVAASHGSFPCLIRSGLWEPCGTEHMACGMQRSGSGATWPPSVVGVPPGRIVPRDDLLCGRHGLCVPTAPLARLPYSSPLPP